MDGQKPSIGRIVHYVSHGTPGGEYGKECRAAIVTEVDPEDDIFVGLCVLNPTGLFFNRKVMLDLRKGFWDADTVETYRGGTWHWPERV